MVFKSPIKKREAQGKPATGLAGRRCGWEMRSSAGRCGAWAGCPRRVGRRLRKRADFFCAHVASTELAPLLVFCCFGVPIYFCWGPDSSQGWVPSLFFVKAPEFGDVWSVERCLKSGQGVDPSTQMGGGGWHPRQGLPLRRRNGDVLFGLWLCEKLNPASQFSVSQNGLLNCIEREAQRLCKETDSSVENLPPSRGCWLQSSSALRATVNCCHPQER